MGKDTNFSGRHTIGNDYCLRFIIIQTSHIMVEKVTLEMNEASGFDLRGDADCKELSPKALLLYAGAKCAGLTALNILRKERVEPQRFEIRVSGELSTETLQSESVFRSFNVVYDIECARDDEQAKVSRAINLAHEKYCGTVQMLGRIAPVSHEIAIVSTQSSEE